MTDEEKCRMKVDEGEILAHYGFEAQVQQLKEELIELFDAATGYIEKTDTKEHFLEEIADVRVMCDQMTIHFNAGDKVEGIMKSKVQRQKRRIANELRQSASKDRAR